MKQVGRELGVRYVLEGSVRKGGNRVRITGQLIDAETGAHLWADRFDGSLEDVFELQDKVAIERRRRHRAGVAGRRDRPFGQPPDRRSDRLRPLSARLCDVLVVGSAQSPRRSRLMEQAIARDPRYGPALAWAALCCFRLLLDGRSEDPEADRRKGADFARRALEVAGDDPGILANAAMALAYFGEDIGAMMALVDRALALNPNFARGWHHQRRPQDLGGPARHRDRASREAALRLSPRARLGTHHSVRSPRIFSARRFDEAVPKLLLAIQEDPSLPMPLSFSRRLLRPYGPARRGARNRRAATRHHPLS